MHCCILARNLAPLKEQKCGFCFQGRALGDEKVMKRARTCYITETQKGQETREEACQLTANIEAVSDQWFLSSLSVSRVPGTAHSLSSRCSMSVMLNNRSSTPGPFSGASFISILSQNN